jgi:hypothetical protein
MTAGVPTRRQNTRLVVAGIETWVVGVAEMAGVWHTKVLA